MTRNGIAHPMGFIAIVHTTDSVRFATTAGTRSALIKRVAEYVCDAAPDRLSVAASLQVLTLMKHGLFERGIERYFTLVGERWDEEWLVTAAIGAGMQPEAFALVDCVVPDTGGMAAVA